MCLVYKSRFYFQIRENSKNMFGLSIFKIKFKVIKLYLLLNYIYMVFTFGLSLKIFIKIINNSIKY